MAKHPTLSEDRATEALAAWLADRDWTVLATEQSHGGWVASAEETVDKVVQLMEQIEPNEENLSRLRTALGQVLLNHGVPLPDRIIADLAAVAEEWS